MAAIGVDKVTDGMVDDWCATLNALGGLDAIEADRVAYLGFAMGTWLRDSVVRTAGSA